MKALQRQGITSNQDLSQKRAENVMEYLISQGVKPDLISAKGFGEADPVATNDTAKGRAQNRRVELSVPASGCWEFHLPKIEDGDRRRGEQFRLLAAGPAWSDPAIRLIDAEGWFDGEIGETWTAFAAARHLPPGATGSGSRTRTHVREAFQQRRCLVPVEQFLW
jgi:hypothetical protein